MVLLAHIIVAATASFRQTRQWWRIVLGMIFNRSVAKELIVLADPVVDANVALVTSRNRDWVPHEVSLEEAGAGDVRKGIKVNNVLSDWIDTVGGNYAGVGRING
jgi:hypothetical protein